MQVVFNACIQKLIMVSYHIMKIKTRLILTLALAGALAGCAGTSDKEVLVRIDKKHTITLKDFNDRIAKMPERYREVINKNRKQFLDEIIVDILLYNEALKQGLDSDEEVKQVVKEARKKILIARLLQSDVEDEIVIGETEIDDYYVANREKFAMPEVLRASHILVRTEDEAKDILGKLSAGANFEKLARTRSVDPSAKIDGDIGFFTRGQLVPEIEEACSNMQIDEISGVIKTKFGYHVVKLTERRAPHIKDLVEVRDIIRQTLERLKKRMLFQAYISKLKEKSTISVNEELLNKISGPEEPAAKPQE